MQHSSRQAERPKRPTRERMSYEQQQQRRQAAPVGRKWQRTDKRTPAHEQHASE